MKYFVFSDAHGDFEALMRAVEKYGYQPDCAGHTLVSCGDNFGRAQRQAGGGSKEIFEYLTSTEHKNPPVCIKGNHELILKDIITKRRITADDISNGEGATVCSFLCRQQPQDMHDLTISTYDAYTLIKSPLYDWLLSIPYYFETERYIFVHGFLPYDFVESKKFFVHDFGAVEENIWQDACRNEALPAIIKKFEMDYPSGIGKSIVFGHCHNSTLNKYFPCGAQDENSVWKNERLKLIGLDCNTVVTHRVEMIVIED